MVGEAGAHGQRDQGRAQGQRGHPGRARRTESDGDARQPSRTRGTESNGDARASPSRRGGDVLGLRAAGGAAQCVWQAAVGGRARRWWPQAVPPFPEQPVLPAPLLGHVPLSALRLRSSPASRSALPRRFPPLAPRGCRISLSSQGRPEPQRREPHTCRLGAFASHAGQPSRRTRCIAFSSQLDTEEGREVFVAERSAPRLPDLQSSRRAQAVC